MVTKEEVESLHNAYISLWENTPWNKRNGAGESAYHKWYDAAYLLFRDYPHLHLSRDYNRFVDVENNGNCFVLGNIYDTIRSSYKVLDE